MNLPCTIKPWRHMLERIAGRLGAEGNANRAVGLCEHEKHP